MQESDLELLIRVAREAGELALDYAGPSLSVTEKPDGAGPVTNADFAVDALLKERLLTARPGYGWLSEETPDSADRLETARTFIVDPIDGTRAYISGSKDWAHSVAVVERGRVLAGIVYLPARGALYAAEAGQGATRNGEQLQCSIPDSIENSTVLTTRPTLAPEHWLGNETPAFEHHFRSSLAWRFCLVAEGRFDAMLTLRPAWEWDIAAGALIAAEAGCAVTDRTGAALLLNRPTPLADGVIAAAPALHAEISGRLL